MQEKGKNNIVETGANVSIEGHINGNNNRIRIGDGKFPSRFKIRVDGNDCEIDVDAPWYAHELTINCGTNIPAHRVRVRIGKHTSFEPGSYILANNSGNRISIGERCMVSTNVYFRLGESPHLLFDSETGEYLDLAEGIEIGDDVWIGQDVYITKRAAVARGTVIGARSVVTRVFTDHQIAIAGNPARIIRRNIKWIRNPSFLDKGSKYEASNNSAKRKYDEKT